VTHLTGRVDRRNCSTYEAGLQVCTTDIDAYLKTQVLEPLGMADSGYVWNDLYEARAAHGHDIKGEPHGRRRASAADAARYAAAGGLHTTPTDYATFLIEIIDPKPRDDFRLGPESLREMLRPHVGAPSEFAPGSWALGWQILHFPDGDVISHGGANPGYQAFAAASVERRSGFVVLTNGDGGYGVIQGLLRGDGLSRLLAA
jgi:CubicO group peptidase (beta-lactamase class C family)